MALKRRKWWKPWAAEPDEGASATVRASEAEQVRALLAKGSTKSAVEVAKEIHKRYNSPDSEGLLVDAYAARIRSLLEHGLATEAKALLGMVRERYSSAKGKLEEVSIALNLSSQGGLDDLVRPLSDPNISEEKRTAVEGMIQRRVNDLSALAQCSSLPPDHALRTGAVALQRALEAVTSGPVSDDALLLPEVSHRGPLATWKLLVRAIACFYRQEDAACERYLQAIPAESCPARLVPAIRAMLSQEPARPLQPAAAALVAQVGGSVEVLRSALKSLDAALTTKAQEKIIPEIRRAIAACRAAYPELVERLGQHISIRGVKLKLPPKRVQDALGGPTLKNAYFWRLFARAQEDPRDGFSPAACNLWEQFRRHAIEEGWFGPDSPEAAALYLHMADLMDLIPPEELVPLRQAFIAKFLDLDIYYQNQPPAIRAVGLKYKTPDFYYLFPEQLYQRASAIHSHPEVFEKWLNWARQSPDKKMAEEAADAWRRALPKDSRPLLHLMDFAEKRQALKKAIGLLEQAEKLDALNPEVRRARIRLLVMSAIRHLQQRKPHLAEHEFAALESLPQAQEGDRPAFLAALRWISFVLREDREGASRQFARVSAVLESEAAAALTCGSVGDACRLSDAELDRHLLPQIRGRKAGPVAAAVARACSLGDDMGVRFGVSGFFEDQVLDELSGRDCNLDVRQLRTVAEAALRNRSLELAYAASVAGLAKGGATEARFLLLRAQALPAWEFQRQSDCIAAAAELARRQRDMALVDEAVELKRRGRVGGFGLDFLDFIESADGQAFSLTTEKLNAVLKRERKADDFPSHKPPPFRGPSEPFDRFEDDAFLDEDDFEEAKDFEPTFDDVARFLLEMTRGRGKKKRRKKRRRQFSDPGDLPF